MIKHEISRLARNDNQSVAFFGGGKLKTATKHCKSERSAGF